MNTTKSVYNKLFSEDKVELGKHEVELGLADDVKKLMQEALTNKNKYTAEAFKAVDQIKKAKIIAIDWRTNLQDASKKLNDVIVKAKEIGFDVPKEILAYQDVVSKGIKDSAAYVTKLNNMQMEIPTE
jgi:hypothetical protein